MHFITLLISRMGQIQKGAFAHAPIILTSMGLNCNKPSYQIKGFSECSVNVFLFNWINILHSRAGYFLHGLAVSIWKQTQFSLAHEECSICSWFPAVFTLQTIYLDTHFSGSSFKRPEFFLKCAPSKAVALLWQQWAELNSATSKKCYKSR